MDLVREEKFVPGVDAGLRAWLRMRQELRDARNSGYNGEMTLLRNRFRFKRYWDDKIPYDFHADPSSWEKDKVKKSWQEEDVEFLELLQEVHDLNLNDEVDVEKHQQQNKIKVIHDLDPAEHSSPFNLQDVLDSIAIDAIEKRHEKHLALALKHHIKINQTFTRNRRTLLHLAAMRGDVPKVKLLLMAGANPNAVDKFRNTPLMLAMNIPRKLHDVSLLNDLLDCGADIDMKNIKGHTALHIACIISDLELIGTILRRAANILMRDKKKKMPIEYSLVQHSMHTCHRAPSAEIKALFNQNTRFIGKAKLEKMWARILSRQFVAKLFDITEPNCVKCKRKINVCVALRRSNYRHWLLMHNKVPK